MRCFRIRSLLRYKYGMVIFYYLFYNAVAYIICFNFYLS